jgi:hypothetical protein
MNKKWLIYLYGKVILTFMRKDRYFLGIGNADVTASDYNGN